MRSLIIATLVVLAAGAASAERLERSLPPNMPHRGECIRLTKQLVRYAGDVERARDRDNALWEKATLQQIDRLATRRRRLCPELAAKDDPALRRLGRLLGTAAALALKYFAFGAL